MINGHQYDYITRESNNIVDDKLLNASSFQCTVYKCLYSTSSTYIPHSQSGVNNSRAGKFQSAIRRGRQLSMHRDAERERESETHQIVEYKLTCRFHEAAFFPQATRDINLHICIMTICELLSTMLLYTVCYYSLCLNIINCIYVLVRRFAVMCQVHVRAKFFFFPHVNVLIIKFKIVQTRIPCEV